MTCTLQQHVAIMSLFTQCAILRLESHRMVRIKLFTSTYAFLTGPFRWIHFFFYFYCPFTIDKSKQTLFCFLFCLWWFYIPFMPANNNKIDECLYFGMMFRTLDWFHVENYSVFSLVSTLVLGMRLNYKWWWGSKCGVPFHCYCPQVLSDSEWVYLFSIHL